MPNVETILLVVIGLVVLFVVVAMLRAVRIVPQSYAIIVERLGKFQAEYFAGLHLLMPFIDRVRTTVDLREQVVSFPPQPVITSDNVQVNIDSVIYYQVTDPKRATYEISNYLQAIEQKRRISAHGGCTPSWNALSRTCLSTRRTCPPNRCASTGTMWPTQIGRASCRERV